MSRRPPAAHAKQRLDPSECCLSPLAAEEEARVFERTLQQCVRRQRRFFLAYQTTLGLLSVALLWFAALAAWNLLTAVLSGVVDAAPPASWLRAAAEAALSAVGGGDTPGPLPPDAPSVDGDAAGPAADSGASAAGVATPWGLAHALWHAAVAAGGTARVPLLHWRFAVLPCAALTAALLAAVRTVVAAVPGDAYADRLNRVLAAGFGWELDVFSEKLVRLPPPSPTVAAR